MHERMIAECKYQIETEVLAAATAAGIDLDDYVDDAWANATESADNGYESAHRIQLPDGHNIYIDVTNAGIENVVLGGTALVADTTLEEYVATWDLPTGTDMHRATFMAAWGYDGLGYLQAAPADYDGPCWIWRQPNYYEGTINAPQPGLLTDDDPYGTPREFSTRADAQAWVDQYHNAPSAYDGIKQCHVLSHGQAGPDVLTIVQAE